MKAIKIASCVVLLFIATAFAAFTTITSIALVNSTIDSTPIGATTPSTGAFTSLIVNTSIPTTSSAVKIFQSSGTSCTTSGTAGNVCTSSSISIPGPAFADTGYFGGCETEGANTGSPVIQGLASKTTNTIQVGVLQGGSVASSYGTIDCWLFHP